MTALGTVPARMVGGPMARRSGEVVAPPPDELTFGRDGGFVYRLDDSTARRDRKGRAVAVYRYDRARTRAKLRALGVPLGMVGQAVDDDTLSQLAAAGVIDRPELGAQAVEVAVRVELHADEWRAYCADELVDTQPRAAFDPDDVEGIRAWAEQLGIEYATRLREQREQEAQS